MTAKIKLNHSGGNGVSLNAPANNPSISDVAFKLPQADGSNGQFMKTDGSGNLAFASIATGVDGITMANKWHLTGNKNITSSNTYFVIDTPWQESTAAGYNSGKIGTGMTESSGLFTFPSTGIYLIIFDCITGTSNDQLNMWSYITVGTDTSSTNFMSVKASSGDAGTMNTVTGTALLDVTNTSTQKVHFKAYHYAVGGYVSGASDGHRTCATFIRLGDT
tara:strand:+ start:535 stop:1194 length:660 start_codon:yes stop_codon:yes gene_type:complete